MTCASESHSYKTVGKNGQLSLGKEFAGSLVELVTLKSGDLLVRRGEFVSAYEKRLLSDGWGDRIKDAQKVLDAEEIAIDIDGKIHEE